MPFKIEMSESDNDISMRVYDSMALNHISWTVSDELKTAIEKELQDNLDSREMIKETLEMLQGVG